MKTTIIKVARDHPEGLEPAAQVLRDRSIMAFPTETVYGLGAVCTKETALLNIFAVKGRPADNPLILHIYHLDQLGQIVNCPSVPQLES